MLKELHIKNVAVIDEVHIEFFDGFNVLTGETGAGKSILIDSINMALGSRTPRDIIRHGCDFASVDISFVVTEMAALSELSELGVDAEDGLVAISRKLTADGKSTCRINGILMPLAVVREAASALIDIHGQNDNRSLLSINSHLKLLDEYGGLGDETAEYRGIFNEYCGINDKIEELSQNEEEKARRLELLRFQAEEIRAAKLKKGEDEELEQLRDRLYNMESIVSGAGVAYAALYGGEEYTAYDLLRRAEKAIADICRFDPKLEESFERLTAVIAETEDIASDINGCLSKTDFSMAELDSIEERLDLINSLKRKYGNSIDEIIAFGEKAEADAAAIESSDERIAELKEAKAVVFEKLKSAAESLTQKRKKMAETLEGQIADELAALDMPKVRFAIALTSRADYGETGIDSAELMISTNPGEDLKPMSKIASGGELSRIMLAIKSVLSESDTADTMIFDEIDTGVSGRAAQRIAEKICGLSRNKQVLAITHLPQIASMADNHYVIEKIQQEDSTSTKVTLLGEERRAEELARIIGGVSVTDLTRQNAREMLRMAEEKKRI